MSVITPPAPSTLPIQQAQDLLFARQAALLTAGASPPSLGGMVSLFLDASAGLATSAGAFPMDGQQVASWKDGRVGGLTAAQATGASQPTWIKNAYGPVPALRFYGGQTLSIPDAIALRPDSSPFHVFLVVRDGSEGSAPSFYLSKGNITSGAVGYSVLAQYAGETAYEQSIFVRACGASTSKASQNYTFSNTSSNTNISLVEMVLDGSSTVAGFLNGSASSWASGGEGPTSNAYTPPISNTDALVIGSNCVMDLFAVVVVKGAMTADQVAQVRNYLMTLLPAVTPPAVTYGNEQVLWASTSNGQPTYRIPALVRCNDGTLLAFCEFRATAADNGVVSIVMRASKDGGLTWNSQVTAAGDGVNCWHNPAAVVDRTTGRVHMVCSWNLAADTQAGIMAGTSTGTSHAYYLYSDTDGVTWSTPADITSQVKHSGDTWWAGGPGGFEQLANGRLLLACYSGNASYGTSSTNFTETYFIYSDNHGVSWNIGVGSGLSGSGEADFVQRSSDGNILVSMRNSAISSWRFLAYSSDNGTATLTTPVQQADFLTTYCQGGLAYGGGNVVVASKPGILNPPGRANMTVIVSTDFGVSWPASTVIYVGSAAYSTIVSLGNGTFGILYEQGSLPSLAFGLFTVTYPKWSV